MALRGVSGFQTNNPEMGWLMKKVCEHPPTSGRRTRIGTAFNLQAQSGQIRALRRPFNLWESTIHVSKFADRKVLTGLDAAKLPAAFAV